MFAQQLAPDGGTYWDKEPIVDRTICALCRSKEQFIRYRQISLKWTMYSVEHISDLIALDLICSKAHHII